MQTIGSPRSETNMAAPDHAEEGPGQDPTQDELEESSSRREAAEREAVRKLTHRTPEDLHPDPKPSATAENAPE